MDHQRRPNIQCLICQKPIYRRPFEIQKNKGHVFCSSICYGQFNKIEKPCLVCGKPIMAHYQKRTCSRACANKYRTGIKYKTGRPRKDKVTHIRVLKLRLLEERGHKCERCEYSRIEILEVHHKDQDRTNSNLVNLELVCPNCHAEEHHLEKSWLKEYNLPH